MKHTRILMVLLLCLAMILPACSQTPTEQPAADTTVPAVVTTTAAPETTESPYDEKGFLKDDLPDDLDLGNQTIKVFIGDYNNAYLDDMYAEKANGERLNDTIYKTIKSVEERLNVKLEYNWRTYTYAENSAYQKEVLNGILAQDGSKDLLFDCANYAYRHVEGDYFMDLSQFKYIDLEKPWYNKTIIENMPNERIPFLSGDFALANVKNTYAFYFNADLYKALGKTENLYELVDSGKWTMEKMETIIADAYHDVNGDTKKDPSDRFGLTFGDTNKYLGFLAALNVKMFTRTNDDYEFTYGNEHALDVANHMIALVNDNENVIKSMAATDTTKYPEYLTSSGGGNNASSIFLAGRGLFSASLVADAQTIVGAIDFEYGLLPYPKWDEKQENYQTSLQRSCYALIPGDTKNAEAASAVLEALASESYRTLLPEYCEVMLKTRYAQDSDVSRMFDLIAHSIVYDLGDIFNKDAPSGYIRHAINSRLNWTSHIESKKPNLIAEMDELFAKASTTPAN